MLRLIITLVNKSGVLEFYKMYLEFPSSISDFVKI